MRETLEPERFWLLTKKSPRQKRSVRNPLGRALGEHLSLQPHRHSNTGQNQYECHLGGEVFVQSHDLSRRVSIPTVREPSMPATWKSLRI